MLPRGRTKKYFARAKSAPPYTNALVRPISKDKKIVKNFFREIIKFTKPQVPSTNLVLGTLGKVKFTYLSCKVINF